MSYIRYHNGWLTLQRRRVNNNNNNNNRANQQQPNENEGGERQENAESDAAQQQAAEPHPSRFRCALTFLVTFFTSMVPDRPRAAN